VGPTGIQALPSPVNSTIINNSYLDIFGLGDQKYKIHFFCVTDLPDLKLVVT